MYSAKREPNKIFISIVGTTYYGDLDLLYKPEQTKLLHKVMESLGYHSEGEAAKHDHYRKGTTVVEMHRTLLSAQSNAYDYFLFNLERAIPSPGKKYIYENDIGRSLSFTLYHLIEHFIRGGIGIRMVWISLFCHSSQN